MTEQVNLDGQEQKLNLFIPITKVDIERREVWGKGAQEIGDQTDEIMDYSSSKPYFDDWSTGAYKRSGGRSFGNVRAMHKPVAAGKLIAFASNDAEKSFDVGAKIVDDDEWEKVVEGVYTGFSVGGSYVRRWRDPYNPQLTRYTAKPAELSVVDSPCIASATFSIIKSGGVTQKNFKPGNGLNKLIVEDDMEKAQQLSPVQSPEPLPSIPLTGETQGKPMFPEPGMTNKLEVNVERMPDPTAPIVAATGDTTYGTAPSQVPTQDALAAASFVAKELKAAFDAVLTAIPTMVKSAAEAAADAAFEKFSRQTTSATAPAGRMIPVVRPNLIKVNRPKE